MMNIIAAAASARACAGPAPRALRASRSRHASRPGRAPKLVALALLLTCLLLACDWDLNRTHDAPPRDEPSVVTAPATPAPANPGSPPSAQTAAKPAPPPTGPESAADYARPSTDENMGRGFQGVIEVSLRQTGGEPRGLRYLSRGNNARLQVDGLRGQGAFDAVIWGESISIIDNAQRSFRTFDLDDVKTEPQPRNVHVDKTGEVRTLSGVECERYEIDDGPVHVSAWVAGLPGTFAVAKFEKVSGLDIPAWAEELIDKERLPLQATARDKTGKEIYALTLTRYAAGPVDDSMVALPSNYRGEEVKAIR